MVPGLKYNFETSQLNKYNINNIGATGELLHISVRH